MIIMTTTIISTASTMPMIKPQLVLVLTGAGVEEEGAADVFGTVLVVGCTLVGTTVTDAIVVGTRVVVVGGNVGVTTGAVVEATVGVVVATGVVAAGLGARTSNTVK